VTEPRRLVSIRPEDFVTPNILDMSAGEVIRSLAGREAKRRRNADDYSESDVAITFRSAPEGLLEALGEISNVSGVRQSVITKCLSHHVMAWYQSLPQVSLLVKLYRSVQGKSDGFPDIIRKAQREDYEFAFPRSMGIGMGQLRTVSFVVGYLGDISSATGIPLYKLFLTGLCYSLSTNDDGWVKDTVSRFFIPERDGVLAYLREHILTLDYTNRLARLRRGDIEMIQYVESLENENTEIQTRDCKAP